MPPIKLARALKEESVLRTQIRTGMGAISRQHHSLIAEDQRVRIGDSIDLDAATRTGREQEHRWDYLVSLPDANKLVAIEPHTASDKEIRVLVQKKNNAAALLREELRPGFKVAGWHWVTNKVGFSRMEPALRALAQNGIKFHGRLIRDLD
jgi:hypothetical protein